MKIFTVFPGEDISGAKRLRGLFTAALFSLIVIISGCDVFETDGGDNSPVTPTSGFFYLLDRDGNALVMLDSKLTEVKRWNINFAGTDSSLQGITFDGKFIWISCAGNTDKIFKLDASDDTFYVVNSFDAPPGKRGTVRDIAWDGGNLWVLNSGSTTYSVPATLYKVNPADGTILSEYPVPYSEPRGITFVPASYNVYGSGLEAGLYLTETGRDQIIFFRYDRPYFDTLFTSPTPPRGEFTRFPDGITFDGTNFWIVNSSDVSDMIYKVNYLGRVLDRFDLPYTSLGPMVWSSVDVRAGIPPVITTLSPAQAKIGSVLDVSVIGGGFKPGALNISFGAGITVNLVTYNSSSQAVANISIDTAAAIGKRTVTLTNPDGRQATLVDGFEVTAQTTTPYLWLLDQQSDTLSQIRLTDTIVTKRYATADIAPGGSPQGITYDGANLWMCASGTDRTIYKLDSQGLTLGILSSFPAPVSGGTLRGIVWENGFIYLAVSTIGKIYKINPATGLAVDSLSTPGVEPRGVAFANGNLYCNDTSLDSVYIYNNSTSTWMAMFKTPNIPGAASSTYFATGMTYDGSSFWIANSSGDYDYVFQVSMSGNIIRYFRAPGIGAAQVTGIVYTLLSE